MNKDKLSHDSLVHCKMKEDFCLFYAYLYSIHLFKINVIKVAAEALIENENVCVSNNKFCVLVESKTPWLY